MPPKLHPLTEKYPPMEADEFAAFKADLAEHGQKNPIWLFEGKVLDGRNRLRACHELGLDPVFAEFTGTEAEAASFVDSQNLHRRHLNKEWRQKRVREMRAQGMSYRTIAQELGTSAMTIRRDANADGSDVQAESSKQRLSDRVHSNVGSGVTHVTPEHPEENFISVDPSHSSTASDCESGSVAGCAASEPDNSSKTNREPQRIKGRDGKSYRVAAPAAAKPKPAPKEKAQWAELTQVLTDLAQKVEKLVPTPEENERPWELIKSLETTAASLLRQAERLRRRHHL